MNQSSSFPRIHSLEEPYLIDLNASYREYQLPISVKAVIRWRDRVPLLKNEREEWELPGGKLELGEPPALCLAREVREELGWSVDFGHPSHAWVYPIRPDRHVFVLTFFGNYLGSTAPVYSHEHKSLAVVPWREIDELVMPEPYKEAIRMAFA